MSNERGYGQGAMGYREEKSMHQVMGDRLEARGYGLWEEVRGRGGLGGRWTGRLKFQITSTKFQINPKFQ